MKASPSPLSILDFAITKMEFSVIPPKKQELDLNVVFGQYEVDIDFAIKKGDFIRVMITATINSGPNKLPGYSICAEAGCFFKFEGKDKLTPEQKSEIEGYSTIYIGLNALRGLVSGFTANAPFGRYILPSIDLNQLIRTKAVQQAQEEMKTAAKPANKTTKLSKDKAVERRSHETRTKEKTKQ
jgi:preprotein translocase subunit SecB